MAYVTNYWLASKSSLSSITTLMDRHPQYCHIICSSPLNSEILVASLPTPQTTHSLAMDNPGCHLQLLPSTSVLTATPC